MSISSDPVARIYLEIADEAFKRGLREANKQFKQSATEWNSHLQILRASWGAVEGTMSQVFRTAFKVLREIGKGTDEAAKAARELRGDMKSVDDVVIQLLASSDEFRYRIILLNEVAKDFRETFDSPFWSDLKENIIDTGGKLASLLLIPITNFIRVNVTPMLFLFSLVKNFQQSSGSLGDRMKASFSGATQSVEDLWKSMEKLRSAFRGDLAVTQSLEAGTYDPNNPLRINKFSMLDPSFLPGKDSRIRTQRSKQKPADDGVRVKVRQWESEIDRGPGDVSFRITKEAEETELSENEKRMQRIADRYRENIEQLKDWKSQLANAGFELGSAVGQGFAQGIVAMVHGTGNFLEKTKNMIGEFLIQIGTMLMSMGGAAMVGAGIAAVFPLSRPVLDPTGQGAFVGAAAMAAGGALVATGAAMTKGSGGSRGASPQRVSQVSGAGSGNFTGFGSMGQGAGQQTININFNGTVGNPRRAAREIREVLAGGAALGT